MNEKRRRKRGNLVPKKHNEIGICANWEGLQNQHHHHQQKQQQPSRKTEKQNSREEVKEFY